ncbi:MAG TPA: hypothetical protein VGM51_12315 [Armatimonadota bacterium]|jgi:mannan endo-1,4-beta-mannosidase
MHLSRIIALVALSTAIPARPQTISTYDDFESASVNPQRWEVINEAGPGRATIAIEQGRLLVRGAPDRTGAASRVRLGPKAVIEVDALGYSGINQILQLYGGSGGFTNMIEFGIEGAAPDGTPTVHVWTPNGESWFGPAPTPGPYGADKPLHLRVERDGNAYRLLVNGVELYILTSNAIAGDARVVLYGFGDSVSRWDNVRFTGPNVALTQPQPDEIAPLPLKVVSQADGAASSAVEIGEGAEPLSWQRWSPKWEPPVNAVAPFTVRVRASDAAGNSRSIWTTFSLDRIALREPANGQVVGPVFTVAVGGMDKAFARALFTLDGKPAGECAGPPFFARIVPKTDGSHVLQADLFTSSGVRKSTPPVKIIVKRTLYGRNAHVTENGGAFVFPDGQTTVPIAFNDSYTWPGLERLWRTGDTASAVEYVRQLRVNGVNVLRVFLEAVVPEPSQLLESPLGHYNKGVVDFWDHFLPICERHGLTVLISPWDTFWINQPWSASPYNRANGGPCADPHDFIVNPEARNWQKARLRFMIDRWGASPAIFAIDLLNEHDIWWGASSAERKAWVDDIAAYTRAYELKKWGRAHMLTVSSAAAEPKGLIADSVYRNPLFDFATTHLYYAGTVNDPKNVVDPAVSVNHGVRYAQEQSADGRPYTDSESGPIDRWIPQQAFDDEVFHHMSWAHFASGGAGAGMRWPYRQPHSLTPVMLRSLRSIAQVANRLDWKRLSPRSADARLSTKYNGILLMGSGDARQAIVWALHDTRVHSSINVSGASVALSGMAAGRYEVTCWDTRTGFPVKTTAAKSEAGRVTFALPTFRMDMAVTIRPVR